MSDEAMNIINLALAYQIDGELMRNRNGKPVMVIQADTTFYSEVLELFDSYLHKMSYDSNEELITIVM